MLINKSSKCRTHVGSDSHINEALRGFLWLPLSNVQFVHCADHVVLDCCTPQTAVSEPLKEHSKTCSILSGQINVNEVALAVQGIW